MKNTCKIFSLLLFFIIGLSFNLFATTIQITVGPSNSLTFSPASVSAVVDDTIQWVWASGSHTTTSTSIPSGALTWNAIIDNSSTGFSYKITTPGTYNYKCIPHESNGMIGTIEVMPTGIREAIKENYVSLFPNPFANNLTIDIKSYNSSSKTMIEVFDIAGKKHFQTQFNNENKHGRINLNLEYLAKGVYFIAITNDEKSNTYKIVKSDIK